MIKLKHKKLVIYAAQIIFIILSLIYLIYRPFFITKVIGKSMEPSLIEGQLILASKLNRNYQRFDVVLIQKDDEIIVKRIAYVPGQKILCVDLGYRAFCPIPAMKDMNRQIERLKSFGIKAFLYEIPKDHVYVVGDNESYSEDSRNYGAVPMSTIIAKVIEN